MRTIKKASLKERSDLPIIPMMLDLIQEVEGNNEVTKIRVWVHPDEGDDYYLGFETFEAAIDFIKSEDCPGAEKAPLIAFKGFEINIFDLPNIEYKQS